MPRLAIRPASYREFVHNADRQSAELGVELVEIPVPADPEAELARLAEHGLRASSLQVELPVHQDDWAEVFAPQLAVATELKVEHLFASVHTKDRPRDRTHARLREAGDLAAEAGLVIALETHPDLVTNAAVGRETMTGVDHPQVRINWDTANVHFYNEGVDGIAELEAIAPFIGAVHLKDHDGAYKEWHFPALGRGIVDFAAVFRVLAAHHFDGICTLEIEGVRGQDLDEPGVVAQIAESVRHLRTLGVF